MFGFLASLTTSLTRAAATAAMTAGEAALVAGAGAALGMGITYLFIDGNVADIDSLRLDRFCGKDEKSAAVAKELAISFYQSTSTVYGQQFGADALEKYREVLAEFERAHGRAAFNLALASLAVMPGSALMLGPEPKLSALESMVASTVNSYVGTKDSSKMLASYEGPAWSQFRNAQSEVLKRGVEVKKIPTHRSDDQQAASAA